jgi:hypothetical protein
MHREDSSDDESISSIDDDFSIEDDEFDNDVWETFQTDIEYHIPYPKARPRAEDDGGACFKLQNGWIGPHSP